MHRTLAIPVASGLLALGLTACLTPAEHLADADDEVLAIVAERRSELDASGDFRIAPPEDSLRARVLAGERPPELAALTLEDCQRIAAENSRTFQDRRESLYLAALDLTLQRYAYGLSVGAGGNVTVSGNGSDSDLSTGAVLSLQRVLGNGADVVLDIGADFFQALSTGDAGELVGDLGLTVTRPLLGAASDEAIFEPLTAAERAVVYEARRYERFRRTFAVDVYERFWRILQEHEVAENELQNVESLRLLAARNRALGEAGRLAAIEVGESDQDELRAESRLVDAEGRLQAAYDDFKFFLGLPVDLELRVDRSLSRAASETGMEGLAPFDVPEDRAYELALERRMDLATTRDRVEDARRALRIAEEELGFDVGLTVTAGLDGTATSDGGFENGGEPWSVGLGWDSTLDRFSERNAYRSRVIALEASLRDLAQAEDQLLVDLRRNLRGLREAEANYEIQLASVANAERQVESTELSYEAGRAETRFLLDARRNLLEARNSLVNALVTYNLARLDLFLDMELLDVDAEGMREELPPARADALPDTTTATLAPGAGATNPETM